MTKLFILLFTLLSVFSYSFADVNPVVIEFRTQRPIYKQWPDLKGALEKRIQWQEKGYIFKFGTNAHIFINRQSGMINITFQFSSSDIGDGCDQEVLMDINNALVVVKKKYPNLAVKYDHFASELYGHIRFTPIAESPGALDFLSELFL